MLDRVRCLLAAATMLAIAVSGGRAVAAGDLEFSYEVARFELDGNVRGPLDGAFDFLDEFDDGDPEPKWYRAFGTVSEHDGSLFLTSPGTSYPTPSGAPTIVSIAAGRSSSWVYDGSGSFTATAYWEPIIPPEGYHYHFSLFTFSSGGSGIFSEIFGVGFGGINGGLTMEQHRTEISQSQGIYQNTMFDFLPVAAAQITGRIGMRIHFDDATNEAWTSFSLDGGATWDSPFPHGPVFVGRNTGQFILSADPTSDAPAPCTAGCCQDLAAAPSTTIALRNIGTDPTSGNDRLILTANARLAEPATFADVRPEIDGARLVVRSQPSGTVLLDARVPAGLYGGLGTVGWRPVGGGRSWAFADKRASGPSGVARMTISDRSAVDGVGAVKITIKTGGGTYPLPASDDALEVAIVLGNGIDAFAGRCGARTYDAAECSRNASGRSMKCRR